jgi:hypothetical protein
MSTVEILVPPHERIAVWPEVILVGATVRVHVGPPPPPPPVFTVTEAVQVAVPPAPVAVPVKVVLAVIGRELVAPPRTGVTAPIPVSIENVLALVVTQVSVVCSPEFTLVGEATSVHVGAGGVVVTMTVAVQVAVPPTPVTVPV